MPSTIRTILLDLDGTLADSLHVMYRVYEKFLAQFKCTASQNEFISLNGPALPEVVSRLKTTHHLALSDEELLHNYLQLIDQIYLEEVKPNSGAALFLQTAAQNQCAIGIVTSNSRKLTQNWIETVGLSHWINFIVSGDEVIKSKPHPEPYIMAAKLAQCPLAHIIAVEDSMQGVKAAREAGIRTFKLQKTPQPVCPDGVQMIQSFNQLSEHLWQS